MSEIREYMTHGHIMRVQLDIYTVVLTPECHEPEDALCKTNGSCSAVEWLVAEENEITEYRRNTGATIPLCDGMPIEIVQEADGYTWAPVTS